MMEMMSGGNIRLEIGRPSDVWYSSCAELVKSHFIPSELKKYEIGSIQVS